MFYYDLMPILYPTRVQPSSERDSSYCRGGSVVTFMLRNLESGILTTLSHRLVQSAFCTRDRLRT